MDKSGQGARRALAVAPIGASASQKLREPFGHPFQRSCSLFGLSTLDSPIVRNETNPGSAKKSSP